MVPISLPYVYNLAAQLGALEKLAPIQFNSQTIQFSQIFGDFFLASNALEDLLRSSVLSSYLRSSRPLGEELYKILSTELRSGEPIERQVNTFVVYRANTVYQQYKTALLAEIGIMPSFFVTQKGPYDTASLLDQPGQLFPPDLRTKVPEAMFDVGEAAKALAYDIPTACGLHTFRATESVLRRYYAVVADGKATPKVRNIGVYINALRQAKCGDEKVLSALDQLSKLHRNPLSHPDAVLTIDDAMSVLGMARSVVTAMLLVIPTPPQTTTTASVSSPA